MPGPLPPASPPLPAATSRATARPRPPGAWLRSLARAASAAIRPLSPRERSVALLCGLAVIAGLTWGGTLLLGATTTVEPAAGGTLRTGIVGQPRFIVPILAPTNDVDMDLSRLLYNGLLTITEGNQLTGDLAESFAVSEDGKTYTVHLRKEVRWHDDKPFTAEDVVLTVRLIQDPAVKSPLAPAFQGVTAKKVDDHTVQFTLQEPYAPFAYSLTVGILPSHLWADVPPQGIALSEHVLRPIGTGPFRFEKLKRAELSGEVREYRLTRNAQYHQSPPLLEGMVFKFSPTTDDLLRALRRGEIDSAALLPPSLVREAAAARVVRVERLRLPQYFAVFFHQAKSIPVSDVAVRRALASTVDRDRLVAEALLGEGVRTEAPLPPGTAGSTPDRPPIPPDLEKARQNLDEAGWKDSAGNGIREKDGTALRFTLATTDWPEYVATAKLLAEQWRAIGVEVAVQPATVGTMQADILRPRNYEALLYGQVLGADPDPYPFWHSTQTRDPGLNLALFKDRTTDRLLEEARKTTDRAKRNEIYRKFEERLIAEVPAVFLYSPTYAYALPKSLRGTLLTSAPHPADRFAAVHTWSVKTRRAWK